MKASKKKRYAAYILDFIIVLIISSSVMSVIPTSDTEKALIDELNDVVTLTSEKKIDIKTYKEKLGTINYKLSKETVISSLSIITIEILYFVVLPVYNNGQTLGKKALKIKIKNNKKEKLAINNMLIRELILHSIGLNIVTNVLVLFLKAAPFIKIKEVLDSCQLFIIVFIIGMILFRKDGRGLHDIVSGTIVVNEEEKG